jgi:hypothetical protein
MIVAKHLGRRRQQEAVLAGRPDAHGFNGDNGLELHVNGVLGEIAAARALDVPYTETCNTFKDPDLPCRIQVRTRSKHYYELIVRDDDSDNEAFLCVTGRFPGLWVRGWLYGWQAKQTQWRRSYGNREPAWFVPHAELRTVGELRDIVRFWDVRL